MSLDKKFDAHPWSKMSPMARLAYLEKKTGWPASPFIKQIAAEAQALRDQDDKEGDS